LNKKSFTKLSVGGPILAPNDATQPIPSNQSLNLGRDIEGEEFLKVSYQCNPKDGIFVALFKVSVSLNYVSMNTF
jgi:hypothetical protein